MGVFFVIARTNSACHLYDNPNTEIPLTHLRGVLISSRHQECPAAMQDQQPGRDAKVLPRENRGMREWDQTDPPNKSLTGIFRRLL